MKSFGTPSADKPGRPSRRGSISIGWRATTWESTDHSEKSGDESNLPNFYTPSRGGFGKLSRSDIAPQRRPRLSAQHLHERGVMQPVSGSGRTKGAARATTQAHVNFCRGLEQ